MTALNKHLPRAALGLTLGFGLGQIGFGDYTELHHMFTFSDLRLLLTFLAAVGLTGLGFAVLRRRGGPPVQRLHRGTILGGVIFGAGWVLCGACPGIVLVQLGEGRAAALVAAAGIFGGSWLQRRLLPTADPADAAGCEV